ncbi:hypothetical protein JOD60_000872 [Microbacterium aurum]|nr:hypothetical protein [Microbacterium aurum]
MPIAANHFVGTRSVAACSRANRERCAPVAGAFGGGVLTRSG